MVNKTQQSRTAAYTRMSRQDGGTLSRRADCRFMAHHADKLGPLGRTTVQELGWAQREIISVPPEMAAIDAMRKMQVAADDVCTPCQPP